MADDTLLAAQTAVINAAKAMFAPYPSSGQMESIDHHADMQKALHGAVRELQKAESYFAGHPLTHEPEEAYLCRECNIMNTEEQGITLGGVSAGECGQCCGSDIQWYVVVPVDDHHQMDTAKDALTRAMENYHAKS